MKAKAAVFALFLGCMQCFSQPITLGNSNMPGNNDTLRFTNVSLTTLGQYQAGGANASWNFSGVTSTSEGLRRFKSALSTPYAFFFLSPNEYGELVADTIDLGPVRITKYYNFYKKQSTPVNAFVADGAGLTLSMVPLPAYFSDKDELYVFPLTYNNYDSTTFRFSTLTTTAIPVRYSKAGYRVTKADGWGTVTTPYGTENCLRLVTTQYSMDTIRITGFGFPVSIGIPNNVRSYQWMTLNSKIPYMEVTGNLVNGNFTVTQARYRGYDRSKIISTALEGFDVSALEMYPNPVKDQMFLVSRAPGTYSVFSQSGQLLLEGVLGTGLNGVDVGTLAAGLYVCRITSGDQSVHLKFVRTQ
jgi:hypothetical protein